MIRMSVCVCVFQTPPVSVDIFWMAGDYGCNPVCLEVCSKFIPAISLQLMVIGDLFVQCM